MRKLKHLVLAAQFLFLTGHVFAQQVKFNKVIENKLNNFGLISSLTQDRQGYIWFTSVQKGLHRYDGKKITTYSHDNDNPNSLVNNLAFGVSADSSGYIWVSTAGFGLDRFDPATNKFTHFRQDPKNPSSLNNDSVFAITTDKTGNVWIGTYHGLDMYDHKTGRFTHYNIDDNLENTKPSDNVIINVIYEDKKGILWIGWGNSFNGKKEEPGGLIRFDRTSGKITSYKHDPADANSLADNNVNAIFEDSKNNFWVGTNGDGLHLMDRITGKFTHFNYDAAHPEKLSRPPLNAIMENNFLSFITEDIYGRLWIGSTGSGINMYDPAAKKTTHFGSVANDKTNRFAKDTLNGFTGNGAIRASPSKDGLLWIADFSGNIYNINFSKTTIPYFPVNKISGSFYLDKEKNNLWIGTDSGLVRRNIITLQEKLFKTETNNENSLSGIDVWSVKADKQGNLWIATHYNGLNKLNLQTEKFTVYHHDKNKPTSLVHDSMHAILFDNRQLLWIGTHKGLSSMDTKSGICTNYIHDEKDSLSLSAGYIYSIGQDKENVIWVGTNTGLNKLDNKTGKFRLYLKGEQINIMYLDASGRHWAGGGIGLYYFDVKKDNFIKYTNPVFPNGIEQVGGIIEDDKKNLWINTGNAILKINEKRDGIKIYNETHGVQQGNDAIFQNYKTEDGRLFLGSMKGYYSFYPGDLNDSRTAPLLQFTNFKIFNKEIFAGEDETLTAAVWQTENIKLSYNQNTFSFEFNALDYKIPGEIRYLYKLENYDNDWRDIGTEHKATFFSIPPGKYTLYVKAVNAEGSIAEKIISISITPPWWKTWWAYMLYAILFILAGYAVYKYQQHYIVTRERDRTQQKELAQAKEIEKAYTELKATQAQLIQSEKMASLGELTAGIAHEIQNPLNFVNNFAEVNSELIGEMKEELAKGNMEEAKVISNDIDENEKKIIFHGKRADAIVKGMLQHSRSSSGVKEPTDINALCDEYLRLAYHGLRAKDKSFNATMKTDFDETIGNINIIPQDIGRVILNLITNAFYVVDEKKKQIGEGYEPTVTVSTKLIIPPLGGTRGAEISVKDNGNGIPQKVLDKIFQPFFTTKPTGQGTGLGLSLSYDIVKAHGGEIKVETKENEGTSFIILLPVKEIS
jgi:ligand-binding sensor domain-containing protein/signal transduction histidine kinase